MTAQQIILLTVQASVIVTVFTFGLQTKRGDLLYVLKRPVLLLRSFASMFIVMPVVALVFATVFNLPAEAKVALVSLALSPIPPLLPKKQDKAGGTDSYALGLMFTMALLSVVFIPIATHWVGRYFDRPYAMPPSDVAVLAIKMAVAPLLAGWALQRFFPAVAALIAKPAALVAGILLPVAGLVILYAARHAIVAMMVGGTAYALLAFVIVGLVVGHVLGGPTKADRVVLALSTASRHPGIAVGLGTATYPEGHGIAAVILLYLVLSIVVSIFYMKLTGNEVTEKL